MPPSNILGNIISDCKVVVFIKKLRNILLVRIIHRYCLRLMQMINSHILSPINYNTQEKIDTLWHIQYYYVPSITLLAGSQIGKK